MKTREEHIKAIIDDDGLSSEDISWIAGQLVAISLARMKCPDPSAETHQSPDCKQRKHDSCTGDGWCGEDDALVACSCWCHTG